MPEVQDARGGTKPESKRAKPGPRSPHTPTRVLQGRVLIVDDGPENRHLLRIILGKLGLEVESAENGMAACRMAEQSLEHGQPFNLIIMDMQMPELDGYEATRRLRRGGWNRPIVALTAYALPGDREKCLAAGCDEYLAKPVDRRKLLETIADRLGQPRLERPASPSSPAQRSLLDDPRISPADRARIVDSFLGSLAERMARIQQALLEDDRERLITEVHAVAGTAGLLGFSPISERARELEGRARTGASFRALHPMAELLFESVRAAGSET